MLIQCLKQNKHFIDVQLELKIYLFFRQERGKEWYSVENVFVMIVFNWVNNEEKNPTDHFMKIEIHLTGKKWEKNPWVECLFKVT